MTATRDDLVLACEKMRAVLAFIAGHLTTDEGDEDATEEEFGLPSSEVIEMAHENMIEAARKILADTAIKKVVSL